MVKESDFEKRLKKHHDELKWLYMELYGNDDMFFELCSRMQQFYEERSNALKTRDREKETDPEWFRKKEMLGMMLYIDNFAGTIRGVEKKLDYIQDCNVNCIHLMPFLDVTKGKSDGGYAVKDFRKVREDLGTMEDLETLTKKCHEKGMNVCMDFVMNHTSEDHEWAVKARKGEGEYMSRYFFFDNPVIPERYEQTVPQVFPTTAPGNFTYLPELDHYVMTTFYPYQWDLNYGNPRVFNEMMYNFLYFANIGMDIIRIDAVPYIWKEMGTPCRNLKQVHTIVRMMRMIGEIVCPATILLGEVVMEPEKVAPYFGTVEKPECHMLYNVTTMATIWHSLAAQDTSLLKKQLDTVCALPGEYTFLNYLRCHDDIGWGLDFDFLKGQGMEEIPHKRYLNDYYTGKFPGSVSRGELYNDDPVTQDARFCGTTASMCGIESAGFEQDEEKMEAAIRLDIMLHAYMLMQSGIPMLYSGDEIGQVNDYTYKEDPDKCADSRYIHRGVFRWDFAKKRKNKGTVEGQIFQSLGYLEKLRKQEKVFDADAKVYTYETWQQGIICVVREKAGTKMIGVFNFAKEPRTVSVYPEESGKDMISGSAVEMDQILVGGHDFRWVKLG
ncbi:amylosucrase [Claveliimonas bilis]|uniref:alpha-amylase family protein n=1 Tax=Claveliimonas bilis TaxID=3028070 RepID=UPI001E2CB146|nr:alpha-amylase family protein [Claveliimonas bilis]BCZ26613.1 amylosucrase [Claveliimonas bilis]BDZ84897.1 amylosucrase [Claveliimonas bilis]